MSEHVVEMRGESRARAALELFTALLMDAAATAPLVLVFDDIQWMDHSSLALLESALENVTPLLVVVGSRPVEAPEGDLAAIMERPAAEDIELGPLDLAATRQFVRQVIGVHELDDHVARWIHERADGNAYFIEEVTRNLREEGALSVTNGVLAQPPSVAQLDATALPKTVETVVTRRIDRLRPGEQLALKAAAVIGTTFDRASLEAVYPGQDSALDPALDHLLDHRLLTRRGSADLKEGGAARFGFSHRTTQEVAYRSLLGEHRRQLHGVYARHLVAQAGDNVQALAPELARHFAAADDKIQAIDFLEMAAVQARRNGAIHAEHRFWDQLLSLHDSLDAADRVDKVRQASWQRKHGMLHAHQGRAEVARNHLDSALSLAGVRIPRGKGARAWLLVRQLLWQIGLLIVPTALVARSEAKKKRLNEAARAASDYAEPCYLLNDNFGYVLASLTAANLSARTGEVRVGRPFSTLGYIASLARLRGLSDRYFERALAACRLAHDGQGEILTLNSRASAGISFGRWDEVEDWFTKGEARANELGDRHEWEVGMLMWGHADHFRGDFPSALDREQQVFERSRERGNLRHARWTLFGMIRALDCMGRTGEAGSLLAAHAELFESSDAGRFAERHTTRGQVAIASGDDATARTEALAGLELAIEAGAGDFTTFSAANAACDILLTLLERHVAAGGPADAELDAAAAKACKCMATYGGTHPIGAARSAYHKGRLLQARGKTAAARKSWEQARQAASDHGMPVDEALAEAALGNLERARELLVEHAPTARRSVIAMEAMVAAS